MSYMKIEIWGTYPPPIGGVSIHIYRLIHSLHTIDSSVVLRNFGKQVSNISYVKHVSYPWMEFLLLPFRKKRIIHLHSNNIFAFALFLLFGGRHKVGVTLHNQNLIKKTSFIKKKIIQVFLRHAAFVVLNDDNYLLKLCSHFHCSRNNFHILPAFLPPTQAEYIGLSEDILFFRKQHSIKNRCLRIFPALWFAFILAMALLLLFKVISFTSFLNLDLWAWFFGQITIFQYYTPNLLRNFGVGTPNGSLWTIPVELEFYILLPVFFLFLKHISIKVKFIALFLFSAMFNFLWTSACESGESILDKLIEVSIFPYLYAFLFGGLMFLNWSKIKWFIEGKICYWFLIYGLYCYFADALPGYHLDDWTTLLANLLLGILTISAAFSKISLGKVLHGNDISYGIYIYHMLVINVFVQMKFVGNISYLLMALIITVCIAIISWVFIEKKALSLKYKL